jgi:hypothetical protein
MRSFIIAALCAAVIAFEAESARGHHKKEGQKVGGVVKC